MAFKIRAKIKKPFTAHCSPFTKKKGFTLVELAIVLIIIGLLTGVGVGLIGPLTKRAKLIETRETVKQAKEAFLGYAMRSGKLPCKIDNCTSGCPNYNPSTSSCTDPFDFVGARKLDAWGKNLEYNPAPELSSNDACAVSSTTITVRECTNTDCSTSNEKLNTAFVVYSTGFDADGACTGTSSPFYIREQDMGYDSPCTYAPTNPQFNYDDIVTYASLDEIRALRTCPKELDISGSRTLPTATEDTYYSYQFQASGGYPSYTWELTSGPNYLTIDRDSGLLSGVIDYNTATKTGELNRCNETETLTVTVKDSSKPTEQSNTVTFSLPIKPQPLKIITESLPVAYVGTSNANFADLDGTGGRCTGTGNCYDSYSWSLSDNPNWLSVNSSTGVLSVNNPTTAPPYSFTATLSDGCTTVSKKFSITVKDDSGSSTSSSSSSSSSTTTSSTSSTTTSTSTSTSSGGSSCSSGMTITIQHSGVKINDTGTCYANTQITISQTDSIKVWSSPQCTGNSTVYAFSVLEGRDSNKNCKVKDNNSGDIVDD